MPVLKPPSRRSVSIMVSNSVVIRTPVARALSRQPPKYGAALRALASKYTSASPLPFGC
jgi:hypothetical protein